MRRFFFIFAMFALPAWAAAPAGFTAGQRSEIVQILRDALKNDPSILRDAVASLRASEEARTQAEARAAIHDRSAELLSKPGDPVAGNASGDVTLVEFYDPRCQYCRRMLPGIDALLAHDHGLRLVYKDIPVLGPPSVLESRAILAAQKQGAYLRMQQALMHNPAQPSDAMVAETARGLGLDPVRLAKDMAGQDVTGRIQANMSLARALHVEGTPMFLIGDTVIPGAVDPAELASAIAKARRHS